MGILVEVTFDGPLGLTTFTRVPLEPGMSLNHFRRLCSKVYAVDIISLFLMNGDKVTDTADIREARKVIASPYFTLRSPIIDKVEAFRLSYLCCGSRASTSCQDSKKCQVGVEIISHPNSGKTMFIQSFVHETPKRERNHVIEAVFKKSIDIDSSVVEFAITDTTEGQNEDIARRVRDKQVVLLCMSKEKLNEMSVRDDFARIHQWVEELTAVCLRADPEMYMALVITKYDIMSEFDSRIEAALADVGKKMEVFKVSLDEEALGTNLKTPPQVFNKIAEKILFRASAKTKHHRSSATNRSTIKTETAEFQPEAPSWMRSFTKIFSCMSGRC